MATFLYRLGRFSYRRRGLVILLWVGLLGAFGVGAATLSGPTSNSFSIPGTEAQQAIDLLQVRFPQASAGGATARVVFAAPDGQKLTDGCRPWSGRPSPRSRPGHRSRPSPIRS